jgi:hypothetical protein
MEKGRIIKDGPASEVMPLYEHAMLNQPPAVEQKAAL